MNDYLQIILGTCIFLISCAIAVKIIVDNKNEN